ncbi:Ion channel [Novymonas esmeraldas]|uniref:Ion channel n=1 Tax=Novymonas esmeraldas TaxID=1808958 RepID=A0AAW0EX52_9TRYP
MELRVRVERLSGAQAPTAAPPMSTPATQRLASLEHDQMTHRWFRGVMAFLAFLSYILSIFQVSGYAGNVVLHVLILVLSLAGEVCIVFVYRIKTRFAGVTNPASRAVNPLHSPYLSLMLCEMLVWILMAPPGVSSTATWAQVLDSFIVLRSYVYVLYFTRLSTQSVFKRAVASLCGYRFNSFYLFRHTFVTRHAVATACGFIVAWLGLALLYSKGEEVSYADAVYFCSSTMGTVGYSDVVPSTWVGRFTAFLAWCLGLLVIGWCVSLMHALLRVSTAERNLHTLFRTNKLCAQVPGEAARTIQRAWKLYVAKRDGRNQLSRQFNALLLSNQVCAFRSLRREFVEAEVTFLRSTYTFEDTLSALSRHSSRSSSPAGSPRSPASTSYTGGSPKSTSGRRPFALFKEVKAKSPRMLSAAAAAANTDTDAGYREDSTALTPPAASSSPSTPGALPPLRLRRPVGERQFMHGSVGASAAASDITMRLNRLDDTLSTLIQKAERMVPRMLTSSTEVAS